MKIAFSAAIAAVALLTAPAMGAVIPGLSNTGADADANGIDDAWTLNGGSAFIGSPINPAWQANDGTSRWLTPTANGNADLDPTAPGFYSYTLNFSLAGFDPASASLSGRFAVDNTVDSITLNGVSLGSGGACCSFASGGTFSANSGFVAGTNTLTFTVRNFAQATGNPTGLRVEFLQSAVNAVPEPAAWALMIGGFAAVGAASRRRRSVATTFA
ncbi:MAG: PEPxxWA-CTERM sorting domain-containing protein [Proteobacteria bacterium]|nr:PEPxxWA-CTERM sorting domain-containing protein [Pseudomonadota bacterium]